MFTGIVEELGEVVALEKREGATCFTVGGKLALEGVEIGHSIAVNGVCLTVISFDRTSFTIEAVPETLRRTNLGDLAVGSPVNLERSARAGAPVGGHYLQGHVDGIATVTRIEPEGEALNFYFKAESEFMPYIVPKGFVALDGASLTVVKATLDTFSLTLIPHSQKMLVMGNARVGYRANLEVDVMGKYLENIAGARIAALEARIAELERKLT
ncbi:riboflavin synthase [Candidatus Chlorohelix sp.]|uniref:riboflavin synthase n=1 Tax=Candidatus Chlorohelix sp. TaxID=3139201 RepID=UPI00304BB7A6